MIEDRPSWVNRPVIVAAAAFLVGAIVAGVVVAIILRSGDDDGDTNNGAVATVEGSVTPATSVATQTPSESPTPLNPRNPDDALAAYVQDEMQQTYIGPCPETPPEQTANTICSIELYRSDELVTFTLGPPNSEVVGEAVLTPAENGVWTVEFVERTGLAPSVGKQAVVFGAGDCLTLRAGPGKTQEPLSCQLDGTRGDVIGGPQTADDITWWQIRDLGWASGEFLQGAR